ncbi:MAG: hypothetical protein FWD04_07270, partial [Conexibacteraceae bacterium]|nr:hypothetical protein [Conexibacteraceae bacterium]
AIIGTEAIRRGWRLRPHRVRVRAGRPLRFLHVDVATPAGAGGVTGHVWARVKLQWAWLGGDVEPEREPEPARETARAA